MGLPWLSDNGMRNYCLARVGSGRGNAAVPGFEDVVASKRKVYTRGK